MIYLITGATGEIGSLVVQLLLERGDRPRILVRNEEKARKLFGNRVDVFVGDLAEAATLKALSREQTHCCLSTRVQILRRETKRRRTPRRRKE